MRFLAWHLGLGDAATKQLAEIAAKLHDGNETATMRELIRHAHAKMRRTGPQPLPRRIG